MENRKFILIGAIVLALITTVSFYTYSKNLDKRVERVVAITSIHQGAMIENSMLKLEKVHPNNVVDGAYKTIEEVAGKKADYPIEKGEQVIINRVSDSKRKSDAISDALPKEKLGLGIPTDLNLCVGGQIQNHDRVTVYAVTKDAQNIPISLMLANNVEVLKVISKDASDIGKGQKEDDKKASKSSKEPAVVVVQIDPTDAQKISMHIGTAQFVLAVQSNYGR